MSIDQTDIVDFISIEDATGRVLLTVSDHLDWSDEHFHMHVLQAKLNTYLRFCESGEIYSAYPQAKGRPIAFLVAAKHPLSLAAREFYESVTSVIRSAGFDLMVAMGG
jgi:hypothetical protein